MQTAFKATFQPNKWLFPDCNNGSHNFKWKFQSVIFSVNDTLDMEASWFMAWNMFILSRSNFFWFPSPSLLLSKTFVVRTVSVLGSVYSSREKHSLLPEAYSPKYVIFIKSFNFKTGSFPWRSRAELPFATVKLVFKLWEGHILFLGSAMVSRAAEPRLCWRSDLLWAAAAFLLQRGKPSPVPLQ